MKKITTEILFIILAMAPSMSLAYSNANYYFPGSFETQTYTPVTKTSIMEKSIIYGLNNIPQKNIASLKKILDIDDGDHIFFNKKMIRALVVIDKKIYFIDSNGVVNTGSNSSTFIDKHRFLELTGEIE